MGIKGRGIAMFRYELPDDGGLVDVDQSSPGLCYDGQQLSQLRIIRVYGVR